MHDVWLRLSQNAHVQIIDSLTLLLSDRSSSFAVVLNYGCTVLSPQYMRWMHLHSTQSTLPPSDPSMSSTMIWMINAPCFNATWQLMQWSEYTTRYIHDQTGFYVHSSSITRGETGSPSPAQNPCPLPKYAQIHYIAPPPPMKMSCSALVHSCATLNNLLKWKFSNGWSTR